MNASESLLLALAAEKLSLLFDLIEKAEYRGVLSSEQLAK